MNFAKLHSIAVAMLAPLPAMALQTTGYTSAANDRFSSGYPNTPVENTSPNFVGAGLDWGGVGWAVADATKSFGFLSPQHYLVARHYGGAAQVRIFSDGALHTFSQSKTENTNLGVVFQNQTLGDLSLGTLTANIPASAGMPRYAVLDLNGSSGSNSTSNYLNLPLLLYGRGPNASTSTQWRRRFRKQPLFHHLAHDHPTRGRRFRQPCNASLDQSCRNRGNHRHRQSCCHQRDVKLYQLHRHPSGDGLTQQPHER
jgi:hypothetical protein